MDLPGYRRRKFRHSIFPTIETVGPSTIFWSLVTGPLYYWKRGARIEAILLLVISGSLYFYNSHSAIISYDTLWYFATAVWLVSVVGAPFLLCWSFRRRGWEEFDPDAVDRDGRPDAMGAGRDQERGLGRRRSYNY